MDQARPSPQERTGNVHAMAFRSSSGQGSFGDRLGSPDLPQLMTNRVERSGDGRDCWHLLTRGVPTARPPTLRNPADAGANERRAAKGLEAVFMEVRDLPPETQLCRSRTRSCPMWSPASSACRSHVCCRMGLRPKLRRTLERSRQRSCRERLERQPEPDRRACGHNDRHLFTLAHALPTTRIEPFMDPSV